MIKKKVAIGFAIVGWLLPAAVLWYMVSYANAHHLQNVKHFRSPVYPDSKATGKPGEYVTSDSFDKVAVYYESEEKKSTGLGYSIVGTKGTIVYAVDRKIVKVSIEAKDSKSPTIITID